MDEKLKQQFQVWLKRQGCAAGYTAAGLLGQAFVAGAAAKAEELGKPAAYCVFCFRTVLLRAVQTKGEADYWAGAWNAKFGGGVSAGDRAYAYPVLVPEPHAVEPAAPKEGTDEEGKGCD